MERAGQSQLEVALVAADRVPSDDNRGRLRLQQLQLKLGVEDAHLQRVSGQSRPPWGLGAMRSLRCLAAEALAAHAPAALQSLDCVAHDLYPLLFKTSFSLERTELLARACCELQAEPCAARRPAVQVLADLFVTEGNFETVVRALRPVGPAPLRMRCPALRADSLRPAQLLHVLELVEAAALRRLDVVHNVRLHTGHVERLLARARFPRLTALTLPPRAFDPPPAGSPGPDGEDPHLAAIARALSQMTQLTELSVAFSVLTGRLQQLLGALRTPLRTLDLANCALNHADMAFLAGCRHAAHLEVLDLSGHELVTLYPSTFFRLLGRAAPSLRTLTLEECGLGDQHVNRLGLGLGPCQRLRELRLLGNPLSARALRGLFAALCELPGLRCIEFPVPRDCYPDGAAYPLDEPAMSKFDKQKYEEVAEGLRAVLLQNGRGDIRASTPLFGTFDPAIQETSHELGAFLLQALQSALEKFARALQETE
ncbi:leucine-rich repeat-containing protein 14B [Orycteropus afer afer]|uniref:Leucine-rich repeat-containing protein 14B n=1 Tax=Orycteropus afer afer TaxID=1230840 RepID=A0A8B7B273_ORYAF|nr:leucine-rich repeat-containing protein 14B [Orycteropus afer afer]